MIANYHTHTVRCHHASDSEEAYIQFAIQNGLKTLGFADHTPMPFPAGRVGIGHHRMAVSEFSDYVETLLALRDQIDILIGVEIEYYPAVFPSLLQLLRTYPVDYMIVGQHFIGNEEPGEAYTGTPTEDETVLIRYVDQVIAAIRTGLVTYIAHPDLVHYVGDEAIYRREMQRLCLAARELDIPLEINLLGLIDNSLADKNLVGYYPADKFWQIAKECGNVAVLGCDAHQAHRTGDPAEIAQGIAYAEKFGIPLLQTVKVRSIR